MKELLVRLMPGLLLCWTAVDGMAVENYQGQSPSSIS